MDEIIIDKVLKDPDKTLQCKHDIIELMQKTYLENVPEDEKWILDELRKIHDNENCPNYHTVEDEKDWQVIYACDEEGNSRPLMIMRWLTIGKNFSKEERDDLREIGDILVSKVVMPSKSKIWWFRTKRKIMTWWYACYKFLVWYVWRKWETNRKQKKYIKGIMKSVEKKDKKEKKTK